MSVTLLRTNYAKTLCANYGAKLLKIPDLCKCLYNFYIKTPLLFASFAVVLSRISSGFPLSFHVLALCVHRDFIGTSSEPHRNLIGTSSESHRSFTLSKPYHPYIFLNPFWTKKECSLPRTLSTLNSQLSTLNTQLSTLNS